MKYILCVDWGPGGSNPYDLALGGVKLHIPFPVLYSPSYTLLTIHTTQIPSVALHAICKDSRKSQYQYMRRFF